MNTNWNHDNKENNKVPCHILFLFGYKIGYKYASDNIDFMGGADEDE